MRPQRAMGRSGTERSDILTCSRSGFVNRLPLDRFGALSLSNGQAGV
jgi:hypothetical protein